MKTPRTLLQGVLFLVIVHAWLFATTVIPMSIEELTSAAPQIIQGHAVENWSAWDARHERIYTYTRFQTDETLKGSSANIFTVKQLGGSAGGYTLHVAGVHRWSNGEPAVLFLRPSQDQDGTLVVVGLMQGDFRVRRSASGEMFADNGLPMSVSTAMAEDGNVQAYNSTTKQLSGYAGSQLTLSQLKDRVHAALAGGKELQ